MTEMKTCNKCGDEKHVNEFYKFRRGSNPVMYCRPECKHCFNRRNNQAKRFKQYQELISGKTGHTTRRKESYRENRRKLLEKKRRKKDHISKETMDALKQGDLKELMEEKNGKDKCKQRKNVRKRSTTSKVRRGPGGQKSKAT